MSGSAINLFGLDLFGQQQIPAQPQVGDAPVPGTAVGATGTGTPAGPVTFQRVYGAPGCQVSDQEFPGDQGGRRNLKCVEDVRQHRPVHTHSSWLTTG